MDAEEAGLRWAPKDLDEKSRDQATHENGTSNTLNGITGATNDRGILIAPSASSFVVIAVFISNSRASEQDRAAFIANVARAIGSCSE